jgi:dTDP-4-dehydrorhamnose reductase
MKILVVGANGQLGNEFRKISNNSRHDFFFAGKAELNLLNPESITRTIDQYQPDVVINCAAYTKVDDAEENETIAHAVNEQGVKLMADAVSSSGAKLIHFSTDYVYHINKNIPLLETDFCTPQSVYGKSKMAGELALLNSEAQYIILRVSWLYSSFNNNFVKTMLRLGKQLSQVSVVSDQIGAPTYAADLARDTMNIIDSERFNEGVLRETYNYSNIGKISWSEFAEEIFKQSKMNCLVNEISTAEFGARAPRPLWSVMSKDKILSDYGLKLAHWKESLTQCLEVLKTMS